MIARRPLAFRLQAVECYREADEHFLVLLSDEDPEYSFGALYQLGRSRVPGEYEPPPARHLTCYSVVRTLYICLT